MDTIILHVYRVCSQNHTFVTRVKSWLFCNRCCLSSFTNETIAGFRYKPQYGTVLAMSIRRQLDIQQFNPQLLTKKGHSRTTPLETKAIIVREDATGGRGRWKIERTVRCGECKRAVAFVKSSRAREAVGMEGDGERGQGQNTRPSPFSYSRYATGPTRDTKF